MARRMLEIDDTFWLLLGVVALAALAFWVLASTRGRRQRRLQKHAEELAQDVRKDRSPPEA